MTSYRIKKENIVTAPLKKADSWCALPYPRHPKGCPNYPSCKHSFAHKQRLEDVFDLNYPIYMVWTSFDLKKHASEMKRKHPDWSKAQCRNLLYWQRGVDKRLSRDISIFIRSHKLKSYQSIGEGFGLNVYATCFKSDIYLEKMNRINTVIKLGFLLKRKGFPTRIKRNVKHLDVYKGS